MTNPNERLTTKQVSEEFNIPVSTLSHWRAIDKQVVYVTKYPRHHQLITGKIYYLRSEIEQDLKKMEN